MDKITDEETEVVSFNLFTRIVMIVFTIGMGHMIYRLGNIDDPLHLQTVDNPMLIYEAGFCFILSLVLTLFMITFKITFSQSGQHWEGCFFINRNYVWRKNVKGEGMKYNYTPANYFFWMELKLPNLFVMPGISPLFYTNLKGACRMVYKYQDDVYIFDVGERNALRKWGKIDETEEEYQARRIELRAELCAEHNRRRMLNKERRAQKQRKC